MSKSSLKLFGVVPKKSKGDEVILLHEYAIIVAPDAAYDIKAIRAWLKETGVGLAEKNSAFWEDWMSILNMSDFEMRFDQLMHYFSTYGLELFGIDAVKEGYVYIPEGVFDNSLPKILKAIFAIEPVELIQRCFSLLNSGMALSQETIQDVLAVLSECGYKITGEEDIKNREAEVMFIEYSGILPLNSLKLFRYLIYLMTDQSMIINDKKTKETIKELGRKLPALNEARLIALAQSFNRHKDLWMSIKAAHPKNRPVVNHITKLSKIHHKPMPEVVMNNLTSKHYELKVLQAAAEKASVFQLVRAINALRLREINPDGAVYRIRNSRIWTSLFPPNPVKDSKVNQTILLDELRRRFAEVIAYTEDFVSYAFPTSEKSFIGNIPEGTVLRFPKTSEALLIGIHWDESDTDLDLRAESANLSVGWNTNFRTPTRGIMHSGDMTRAPAPYGASEWLYMSHLGAEYNISLNVYRAGHHFDNKFKFIIGKSSKEIEKNYTIAPDEILTSFVATVEDRQIYLGMIYDDKNYIYYIPGTGATGKGRVGRYSKYDGIQQDVAQKRIQSALTLADVIRLTDDPERATVDLSLDALTKDSFLSLLK